MDNLSAAWLYPIIIIAGVLQAWGPPMNNALKKALVNPWLGSLVSFLPIVAFLSVVLMCLPRPLPTAAAVSQMPWWAPLGGLLGLVGALAVVAGLLFVGKVGAGMFDGRNICGAGSFGTSGQGRAHFPAADQELNDPILADLRRVFIDTEDASFGHREDSAGFIEVSNGERDLLGWPEARKEAKLMEVSLRLTPVAMDLL
jgi:transporter family-2 protein